MFNLKRKVLFGVSVSIVLAMAIGSFALGESQTPASPRAAEAHSAVGATVGAFTVNGGTQGTDYEFTGTSGTDGVLKIHPQLTGTNITISNTGTTTDRIEVTSAATITLAGVNIDRSSITTAPAALTITDNANFDVKILLADNTTNILKGANGSQGSYPYTAGSPGIEKSDDGTVDIDTLGMLTIGVPEGSAGTGKLQATGGCLVAGIGSGLSNSGNNITISGGEITATGGYEGAGIGGGGRGDGSNITITGGVVTATGGQYGAGIGGGELANGSDITITGGVVTATGGQYGAGIGGVTNSRGSDIKITGGVITANGGNQGAGIGGGYNGSGSNITISGGEVTANGGRNGAGIGGGKDGSGSDNSLNGDAVVLAASGNASKAALEGFVDAQQQSLLTQGIAFTGLGTAFDSYGHATDVTWDSNGTVYGSVTLYKDLEMPANLTVPAGNTLTVNQGVTLKIPTGKTLQNDGTITINNTGTINCQGTITTKTDFYLEDSTDVYATGYQTYQTNAGVQKYTNLPNPGQTNANGFVNWYYIDQDGRKTKIDENSFVALNAHSFYENLYSISVADLENGSITPDVTEAAKDDTVTLTVTPDEGYQLKEGSLTVTDADGNEVSVTEQDGKYTFTMPGADVTVSAAFELIPEPSVDPDQGGDGSSKTGDSFTGVAALAILGVATTGATLLRKRK